MHICFVCTGNICRSPMAEMVFGEHLRRAGLADRVRVSSAGTGPWHVGEPAFSLARTVLAEHGYPTDHVATEVNDERLAADLLVALDRGHLRVLRRLVDDPTRVRLLRTFDPDSAHPDVPDPYLGELADFHEVLSMVEAAMPGLLGFVRDELANRGAAGQHRRRP